MQETNQDNEDQFIDIPEQTDPHSDMDVLTEQDMVLLDAHDIADGNDMSDSE